jgi:hypothetical protein
VKLKNALCKRLLTAPRIFFPSFRFNVKRILEDSHLTQENVCKRRKTPTACDMRSIRAWFSKKKKILLQHEGEIRRAMLRHLLEGSENIHSELNENCIVSCSMILVRNALFDTMIVKQLSWIIKGIKIY